jgi:hypothetical protein
MVTQYGIKPKVPIAILGSLLGKTFVPSTKNKPCSSESHVILGILVQNQSG